MLWNTPCNKVHKCTKYSIIDASSIAVFWLQGVSAGSDILEGPSVSVECILEDLDMRIRRLEKWNMVHTVSADSTLFETLYWCYIRNSLPWLISGIDLFHPRIDNLCQEKWNMEVLERLECLESTLYVLKQTWYDLSTKLGASYRLEYWPSSGQQMIGKAWAHHDLSDSIAGVVDLLHVSLRGLLTLSSLSAVTFIVIT